MTLIRLLPALSVVACAGEDKGVDSGDVEVDCTPVSPSVERIDVPTGYRSVDAPVDAPWLTEPRTVPVGIWYPTEDSSGENAMYINVFEDTSSRVDASFADPGPGCTLPLVVYSHGSEAWGGNVSPLLRHLVAQGWIAAAPDHIDNVLFHDVDPRPISFSLTRMADMVATIDLLENLPSDDPLYGRVDTSRVLLMGHSFGGQTAALLSGPGLDTETIFARCDADELGCSDAERAAFEAPPVDPRLVGVMPMDGFAGADLVSAEGWATADLPILYLNRAHDGDDEAFLTAAAADLTWARFADACHETFTNSPVSCDTYDKEEGLTDVAVYLTAFAAERVLGLDEEPYAGILDGSTVVDERITVQRTEGAGGGE